MNQRSLTSIKTFFVLLTVFLSVAIASAQWPTDLYTGKPISVDTTNDEEAVAVAQAPDGTLRLLTRYWYGPYETPYYLGLQYTLFALDYEGNHIWEDPHSYHYQFFLEQAFDHTVYYPVIMKVGPHNETWIAWESFTNSDYGESAVYNNSIRAVRFDAVGNITADVFSAVELGVINMLKNVRHVEVLDDGGMILLWEVVENKIVHSVSYDVPYEVRAQRFDSLGNELWISGGVILDSTYDYLERKLTSGPSVSDGDNGLLLTLGNELQRLRNDGTLAWPRDYLFVEGMHENWQTQMLEIEPGLGLTFGFLAEDTIAGVMLTGVMFDSSGNLRSQVATVGYSSGTTNPPFRWGSGYGSFGGARFLTVFDKDLNIISPIPPDTLDKEILPFGQIELKTMNEHGLRFTIHLAELDNPVINEHMVFAFDTSRTQVWEHQVAQNDTHSFMMLPWLAPDGTTFLFWSAPGEKEDNRDIYANVVDLDGNWGYLQTTSTSERTITPLPNQISLRTWPNPTNAQWVVEVKTPTSSPVTLQMYDILGRCVFSQQIQLTAGSSIRIPFDGSRLAAGIYFIRARTPDDEISISRIVLVK